MQITPPIRLQVHNATAPPKVEAAFRYGAAYVCTLIAVAAAQLRIPTNFAWLLAGITVLGLPVSLYLRKSGLRAGRYHMPRPLLNSAVVILTVTTAAFHFHDLPPMISGMIRGNFEFLFRNNMATEYPLELLMQVFLLFAVYRCFSIINDNDAVLCALASFPVLLLLIVVHRGPQVVAYFFLWSLVSAVLFSLDHRAEARHGVIGHLPSLVPGQDVKLSARSLATVMGFSLLCAGVLSYALTSREADERSRAENWMAVLAGRLTRFSINFPDAAVNAGPERQIDFSSAPALPSRRPLWQVRATGAGERALHPPYWRLFTLARYDGSTWSQTPRSKAEEVPRTVLPRNLLDFRQFLPRSLLGLTYGPRSPLVQGYNVASRGSRMAPGQAQPAVSSNFGAPHYPVVQTIRAQTLSYGFIPMLPQAHYIRLLPGSADTNNPDHIYMRFDDATEVGVLDRGGSAKVISEVPAGLEYADTRVYLPFQNTQKLNPQAYLSPADRRTYLQLPPTLPPGCRVRQLARREVRGAIVGASDYARAQRLESYVRKVGSYTLHPPEIPPDQDAADYFLFKSRRGYCTYYAGALTVLCRAAGIPARVVSGFVNPEWDLQQDVGTLYESNAHAWTEIWVPNWGWATLDATPSDDRGNNTPNWWDDWLNTATSLAVFDRQWLRRHEIVVTVVALIVCGLILLTFAQRQGHIAPTFIGFNGRPFARSRTRLSDDMARRAILQAYHHAAKILTRRFRPRAAWETPAEWLQAAEGTLELQNPEPLRQLTQLYVAAKYSAEPLGEQAGAAAHSALTSLAWQRKANEQKL